MEGSKPKEDDIEVPEVIRLVNEDNVSGVEKMLATGGASVHDTDSTGMTPLMHAAYKGFSSMCRMLIKQVCLSFQMIITVNT